MSLLQEMNPLIKHVRGEPEHLFDDSQTQQDEARTDMCTSKVRWDLHKEIQQGRDSSTTSIGQESALHFRDSKSSALMPTGNSYESPEMRWMSGHTREGHFRSIGPGNGDSDLFFVFLRIFIWTRFSSQNS